MDDKTRELAQSFNDAGVGFIMAELDTAITFCDMALTSRDPAHLEIDEEKAKRALAAANRALQRVHLTPDDQQLVAEKIALLNSLLMQVKERQASARH